VRPPRIAESPVSFECRVLTSLVTGPHQTIVIGRILRAHIDDAVVQDKARCYIDTQALGLIGRMHGSGWYARCTDLFQMDRPTWAEWQRNGAAVGQLPSGEAPGP
jgi:flavin reductase (DIM6/NTAB) family NADH-FMN oxidoreductase RutF